MGKRNLRHCRETTWPPFGPWFRLKRTLQGVILSPACLCFFFWAPGWYLSHLFPFGNVGYFCRFNRDIAFPHRWKWGKTRYFKGLFGFSLAVSCWTIEISDSFLASSQPPPGGCCELGIGTFETLFVPYFSQKNKEQRQILSNVTLYMSLFFLMTN